ncbi:MAG: MAPEG family protein [Alphaproteobacteria bacterium]|nr:MAPEG family protein [Alphaproteobacteria bacterium]MCB9946211.1 MAPEG family protein [Rhodospirillaceae bacterium]
MSATAMVAPELWWLAVMGLIMAATSLPYVLDRIVVRGLWGALDNPQPHPLPQSAWAERMKAAHYNSVENLVVFAPLAVAVVVAGVTDANTLLAVQAFVIARAVYIVVYTLGIPVLRTLAFLVGWLAIVALALRLLGLI